MDLGTRLKHAYNAFMNRDPTYYTNSGPTYSTRPDRPRLTRGNERTIITSVYNRIALDAASMTLCHCKTDDNDQFKEIVKDGLNDCFNLEANKDQTGRAFLQDAVMSMLDEGCVALLPTETNLDPRVSNSYNILSMRTAKIRSWRPNDVLLEAYDDRDGIRKAIWIPKRQVAIIENPFYAVMNEPNSTLQRLIRKLSLLDKVDEFNSTDKIDMIIQLPYSVKGDSRRKLAKDRVQDVQDQMQNSKYGIAYIDSTERVIQLNRSLENNLMPQIEYLTNLSFSQLNITQSILDGTADEKTMLNYYTRTIEPIVAAIADESKRKFLTKTALSQHHTVMYFRDPFRLVPVNDIAEIADKFTRNEIMSANEIRQEIGMKPSKDPKANVLNNSNISKSKNLANESTEGNQIKEEKIQNEEEV